MTVAFLCPGQGAQTAGFLRGLPRDPEVDAALDEVGAALGRDVRDLDGEDALASTAAVQLTTLAAGVAVGRALAARGASPDAVAGLSLGAYTAAVLAGALELPDAVRLVQLRGELMERAHPAGFGMAAVIGLTGRRVSSLVAEASAAGGPLHVANVNAPTQNRRRGGGRGD